MWLSVIKQSPAAGKRLLAYNCNACGYHQLNNTSRDLWITFDRRTAGDVGPYNQIWSKANIFPRQASACRAEESPQTYIPLSLTLQSKSSEGQASACRLVIVMHVVTIN